MGLSEITNEHTDRARELGKIDHEQSTIEAVQDMIEKLEAVRSRVLTAETVDHSLLFAIDRGCNDTEQFFDRKIYVNELREIWKGEGLEQLRSLLDVHVERKSALENELEPEETFKSRYSQAMQESEQLEKEIAERSATAKQSIREFHESLEFLVNELVESAELTLKEVDEFERSKRRLSELQAQWRNGRPDTQTLIEKAKLRPSIDRKRILGTVKRLTKLFEED